MSLINKITLQQAIIQQFKFKLKAYHHLIGSLILFQLVALFFSLFGQTTSLYQQNISITTNIYSADVIIMFTLLWMVIMAFYTTNRQATTMMYTFVTNKRSNHYANGLFMLFLALVGSVTAICLGVATRLVLILLYRSHELIFVATLTVSDVVLSVFITFLYRVLLFSVAYIIGELIQLHRSFTLIVPIALLSLFIIIPINIFNQEYLFSFFIQEKNLFIFVSKVLATVILIWLVAPLIRKRQEVRTVD